MELAINKVEYQTTGDGYRRVCKAPFCSVVFDDDSRSDKETCSEKCRRRAVRAAEKGLEPVETVHLEINIKAVAEVPRDMAHNKTAVSTFIRNNILRPSTA